MTLPIGKIGTTEISCCGGVVHWKAVYTFVISGSTVVWGAS